MTVPTVPETKQCKSCGKPKPIEEFKARGRTGYRYAHCLPCLRQREVDWDRRRKRRMRTGGPVDREPPTKLNGATVALWLGRERWRLFRSVPDEFPDFKTRGLNHPKNGLDLLAVRLGTAERTLFRLLDTQQRRYPIRDPQKTVRLDIFDRWVCHAGEPWLLRELFPALFRFDDHPEYNMDTPLVDIPDDPDIEAMAA